MQDVLLNAKASRLAGVKLMTDVYGPVKTKGERLASLLGSQLSQSDRKEAALLLKERLINQFFIDALREELRKPASEAPKNASQGAEKRK